MGRASRQAGKQAPGEAHIFIALSICAFTCIPKPFAGPSGRRSHRSSQPHGMDVRMVLAMPGLRASRLGGGYLSLSVCVCAWSTWEEPMIVLVPL